MQGPERMAYAAPPAMIARRWCLLVVLVGLHHQAALSRALESGLSVQFSAPVVVGSSNATHFSFPAVGIGLPNGEMVQHVTLCDDRSTCDTGRCAQVLRSSGGVSSFTVQSTTHAGGSGSFNYYGDLGELVPAVGSNGGSSSNSSTTFVTLAGNNGGSWLGHPVVLQHWQVSASTGLLHIARNTTVQLVATPKEFTSAESCGAGIQKCGLAQGGRIIRDKRGDLLAAFGGFASDSPTTCRPDEAGWTHCYTLAFYRSCDNGLTWQYLSRVDQTAAMPTKVEGPCEPTLARLHDGRILLIFRLQSSVLLWKAISSTNGLSWSEPTATSAWAVWPQLLLLSNGVLALSSGRPGLGLWLSADGMGDSWQYYNVAAEHNHYGLDTVTTAGLPLFAAVVASVSNHSSPDTNPTQTTSYTSLVEVSPGTLVVTYDLLRVGCPVGKPERWCQAQGLGYDGGRDFVFAMKVHVNRSQQ